MVELRESIAAFVGNSEMEKNAPMQGQEPSLRCGFAGGERGIYRFAA